MTIEQERVESVSDRAEEAMQRKRELQKSCCASLSQIGLNLCRYIVSWFFTVDDPLTASLYRDDIIEHTEKILRKMARWGVLKDQEAIVGHSYRIDKKKLKEFLGRKHNVSIIDECLFCCLLTFEDASAVSDLDLASCLIDYIGRLKEWGVLIEIGNEEEKEYRLCRVVWNHYRRDHLVEKDRQKAMLINLKLMKKAQPSLGETIAFIDDHITRYALLYKTIKTNPDCKLTNTDFYHQYFGTESFAIPFPVKTTPSYLYYLTKPINTEKVRPSDILPVYQKNGKDVLESHADNSKPEIVSVSEVELLALSVFWQGLPKKHARIGQEIDFAVITEFLKLPVEEACILISSLTEKGIVEVSSTGYTRGISKVIYQGEKEIRIGHTTILPYKPYNLDTEQIEDIDEESEKEGKKKRKSRPITAPPHYYQMIEDATNRLIVRRIGQIKDLEAQKEKAVLAKDEEKVEELNETIAILTHDRECCINFRGMAERSNFDMIQSDLSKDDLIRAIIELELANVLAETKELEAKQNRIGLKQTAGSQTAIELIGNDLVHMDSQEDMITTFRDLYFPPVEALM